MTPAPAQPRLAAARAAGREWAHTTRHHRCGTRERFMKLAYSSLACPGWTVEEASDAVTRYGFDGIEWRLADGEPITSQTPESVLRRVIEATRSHTLSGPALGSSC